MGAEPQTPTLGGVTNSECIQNDRRVWLRRPGRRCYGMAALLLHQSLHSRTAVLPMSSATDLGSDLGVGGWAQKGTERGGGHYVTSRQVALHRKTFVLSLANENMTWGLDIYHTTGPQNSTIDTETPLRILKVYSKKQHNLMTTQPGSG